MIQDSGDRTQFDTGAVRDMHEGKGRCDLLPPAAILRLARHYEAGAKKYGDRNWEKGIPSHSFADSAIRHLLRYMDGDNSEDHLAAVLFNVCGLIYNEEKKPELCDIPSRQCQNVRRELPLKTVYIAGPMTGLPDYNFPAFMAAEEKLRELGYEVINPARIDHKDKDDWMACMRKAIPEMMKADAVVTLPGWKLSRGAQIEADLAMRLTIPVVMFERLVEGTGS